MFKRAFQLNPAPTDQFWWIASAIYRSLRNCAAIINFAQYMKEPSELDHLLSASLADLWRIQEVERYTKRVLDRDLAACIREYAAKHPDSLQELVHIVGEFLKLICHDRTDQSSRYRAASV